jgi:hypothetical protein
MPKILVSVIAYKEKDLRGTVLDCYNKAKNKDDIYFSIVDENKEYLWANLDEIPSNQIRYLKYDLSEYRGIMWARNKSIDIDIDYDYILYICGHTRFNNNWDEVSINDLQKATSKSSTGKAILSWCPPDFMVNQDWSIETDNVEEHHKKNVIHTDLSELIPGYGFTWAGPVPEDGDLHEGYWVHFTWTFAPKKYVEEVPMDPEGNFNMEEPYVTVQSYCRGWRFYGSANIVSYHQRVRLYPGDEHPRHVTHRPWSDKNKNSYWDHSDRAMIKLNKLLSGNLEGIYGGITRDQVLEYCAVSKLNPKWTEYNPEYNKLGYYQHANTIKDWEPFDLD